MKEQKTAPAQEPQNSWQKSPVPNLIRYVPSGIYFARVRIGGKLIRRSLDTVKLSVAQIRLADLVKVERSKRENLQTTQTGNLTFAQAEELFRRRLTANNQIKQSSKDYRLRTLDCLHRTWPDLAGKDLAKISRAECESWALRFREKGYSATVFNNTLGTLKAIFEIALESGARYSNPANFISRMPVRPKKPKLPDRGNFQKLTEFIGSQGGRFSRDCSRLVRFLAYGGFRKGEAAAITWEDCDFKKRTITVRGDKTLGTKNGSIRKVPMIPDMITLLNELKPSAGTMDPEKRVMPIQECQKAIDKACNALGIPRFTHHDLRHLFATTCIESGVDIPTVSRWLGHKDGGALAMKVYGHLRESHSSDMARKVTYAPGKNHSHLVIS